MAMLGGVRVDIKRLSDSLNSCEVKSVLRVFREFKDIMDGLPSFAEPLNENYSCSSDTTIDFASSGSSKRVLD